MGFQEFHFEYTLHNPERVKHIEALRQIKDSRINVIQAQHRNLAQCCILTKAQQQNT